jgi:hypothetical protein
MKKKNNNNNDNNSSSNNNNNNNVAAISMKLFSLQRKIVIKYYLFVINCGET